VREDDHATFTLVGTGSEVGVCLKAHDLLARRGIATRVVALPCWACFDDQSHDYRERVLKRSLPSVALEAGATLGWTKYVDQAIGIDSFGMSAPGSYALDFFHITAATLVEHVERVLGETT
jgi:transketolase